MDFIYDAPSLFVLHVYNASRMKAAGPVTHVVHMPRRAPDITITVRYPWGFPHKATWCCQVTCEHSVIWNPVIFISVWAFAAFGRTESHLHRCHSKSPDKVSYKTKMEEGTLDVICQGLRREVSNIEPITWNTRSTRNEQTRFPCFFPLSPWVRRPQEPQGVRVLTSW